MSLILAYNIYQRLIRNSRIGTFSRMEMEIIFRTIAVKRKPVFQWILGFPANESFPEEMRKFSFVFPKIFRKFFYFCRENEISEKMRNFAKKNSAKTVSFVAAAISCAENLWNSLLLELSIKSFIIS